MVVSRIAIPETSSLVYTEVTSTHELNILDGVTSFLDEDNLGSNSATSIPSQQSVKAYVDSTVAGVAVTFLLSADSGTSDVFQTGQTLSISGTSNEIETAVTDNTITVGLPDNVSVFNNLTVGGNITIGGTLTYEDVTNVDSVGIVTAESGVIVTGAGIGLVSLRVVLELLVLPHPLVDSSVT